MRITPADEQLLSLLREDARASTADIARKLGLSRTTVQNRIARLEEQGVIRGYTVLVDREKVGLHISSVTEVNLDRHSEQQVQRFEEMVAASPYIVRCVSATGSADYILTVAVPDIKRYEQFLRDTLFKMPGVTHVRSSIVLREIKSDVALPLGQETQAASRRP